MGRALDGELGRVAYAPESAVGGESEGLAAPALGSDAGDAGDNGFMNSLTGVEGGSLKTRGEDGTLVNLARVFPPEVFWDGETTDGEGVCLTIIVNGERGVPENGEAFWFSVPPDLGDFVFTGV